MIIGVPKEVKDKEYRVAMTPGGAWQLTAAGHEVRIQAGAGEESGFNDDLYRGAGAKVLPSPESVWEAEMVVKVKEPQPAEYRYLRPGLTLFTFLHLAAEPDLTLELQRGSVTAIAYETVEEADGSLPLLIPMSEVAGRMAAQVGSRYLEKTCGGRGKLLGGVPGVRPADVTIIGAGVVGSNAAQMALGMGANVILLDIDTGRLRHLEQILHGRFTTLSANALNIAEAVSRADLLIGAVLIKGARAPRLVTRQMIGTMKPGSVVVDVSVDQGGCIETTRPATHSDPIHVVDGVLHYGVTNMPGAVPRTSTYALSNATLPYIVKIASQGVLEAARCTPALARGFNTCAGKLTYRAVSEALGSSCTPIEDLL
ncbi:Alanine dehydrogenase [uncultured Desulfatiglans sp.]|nr:Alanine dehydrogenase [uncultured Desulfatiglans sp.]